MSEHDKALAIEDAGCLLKASDTRELLEYIERELQARGYRPAAMLQLAGSIMLAVGCAVVDENPRDEHALKQAMRALQVITQSVIKQSWRYFRDTQSAQQAQKQQGN